VGVVVPAKRFEIYLINLDPTVGKEIKKIRPCLIISPDEINLFLATIIIAPMTTKGHDYPFRVSCRFKGKNGQIILDQIRTVDKSRLIKKLGILDSRTQHEVLARLGEMFTP
jgi:mRNA interferase MazF